MSKELEYIQRYIDIVKQQIKGSKIKFTVTDAVTKHQYDYYENELQTLESIEQSLHRLESIDNADPSVALELVGYLKDYHSNAIPYYDWLNDIEKYILKAQKEHTALEILKRNVKVCIEYGEEKKDISVALVFYIDNKKTIYVVDEAIKEQNPEHFKELELLKEVEE